MKYGNGNIFGQLLEDYCKYCMKCTIRMLQRGWKALEESGDCEVDKRRPCALYIYYITRKKHF